MYILQYIIHLCIEAHRHRAVHPVIARHLVYCVAIRVHALIALGAFSFARVHVHAAPFLVTLT